MKNKAVIADILLLTASIIWGFAFAFQRQGMEHLGPFTYTAIRFILAGFTLLPLAMILRPLKGERLSLGYIAPGLIAGLFLLGGAGFQQWGLVYTTEANSGFITGIYVIIVPIISCFLLKHSLSLFVGLAGLIMLLGMGLMTLFSAEPTVITGKENLRFLGDILTFICALFWSVHILWIAFHAQRISALWLAVFQSFICGFLALIIAFIADENISWQALMAAKVAIIYGAFVSVAIAYTLQIIAQKNAPPSHAVLILSLEAVFGAIGGWLLNGQAMTIGAIMGASLMFSGTLLAEFSHYFPQKSQGQSSG